MGLNGVVEMDDSSLEVVVLAEIEDPLPSWSVALDPKVVNQLVAVVVQTEWMLNQVCSNVVADCSVMSLRVNPLETW